jgi:hypothetical protein
MNFFQYKIDFWYFKHPRDICASKDEVCALVNILIVDPNEYIFFIQSLYEVVKS